MKKIIAILVVLAIAAGAWFYATPWMTLKSIRDAAVAGDADGVSEHVDYEALRADMKDEIMAAAQAEQGVGAELSGALMEAVISPMIDQVVTPEALAVAFAEAERAEDAPLPALDGEVEIDRQGLNGFIVRSKDDPGQAGFEFKRDGLGWKLVGVELPEAPGASAQ
ncbi:DUF2939 domain-containing protein [Sphingomicrobium sediminis]|uniref:DUF2939 domain-containing protein n=1 Tax=Sphingomicrobium sediminis TaxID=2950949 RepID=A0A9X2EJE7_9SPHN|nr:DUF2939 domain-containing protein [Sphingomicrobium sediminis]MCM8556439.1 DUF2939 domain-containing protein [Sphingomicrobium sediminis]